MTYHEMAKHQRAYESSNGCYLSPERGQVLSFRLASILLIKWKKVICLCSIQPCNAVIERGGFWLNRSRE